MEGSAGVSGVGRMTLTTGTGFEAEALWVGAAVRGWASVSVSGVAAGAAAARRKSEAVAFCPGFGSSRFLSAGLAGVVWVWTRTSRGKSVSSTGARCLRWGFAFGLAAGGAAFFFGCFLVGISEGDGVAVLWRTGVGWAWSWVDESDGAASARMAVMGALARIVFWEARRRQSKFCFRDVLI